MTITIKNNAWCSMFGVPTCVVDQYLKLATPSQLKVLLYLLRNGSQSMEAAQVAEALNLTAELVEEAVLFWQQTDLFDKEPEEKPVPTAPQPVAAMQRSSSEVQLQPTEMAAAIRTSGDLQTLFRMTEQQLGRPINHMEQRSLVWLHDYLGFQSDMILTVLGYCYSVDKSSIAYAERILIDWWNQGITTLQQAQSTIKQMEQSRTYLSRIMKLFEMHRNPTPKQKEYIEQWQQKNIPFDLIRYAYEKTIEQTDKLSFPYINRILTVWADAGFQNRLEVDTHDKLEQNSGALKSGGKKKEKSIPVSEMADAYKSLVYNLDE